VARMYLNFKKPEHYPDYLMTPVLPKNDNLSHKLGQEWSKRYRSSAEKQDNMDKQAYCPLKCPQQTKENRTW